MSSPLTTLRWIVWRDAAVAWRRPAELLSTLSFFVMVVSLFPLAIGADSTLLRSIAAGAVWTAALLACVFSLNRLLAGDYSDGALEQMALSPQPLYLIVLGKVLAQILVSAPVILLAPLLAMQLGAPSTVAATLGATVALGIPTLCLVGSIGAGLTLGTRNGGFLLSVLTLPLFIPVLIFGAGASLAPAENIALLAALLILSALFAPLATAAALRLALE